MEHKEHYFLHYLSRDNFTTLPAFVLQCYNQKSAILIGAPCNTDFVFLNQHLGEEVIYDADNINFSIAGRDFSSYKIIKYPLCFIGNLGEINQERRNTHALVLDIKNLQDDSFHLFQVSAPFSNQDITAMVSTIERFITEGTHFILLENLLLDKAFMLAIHEIDPAFQYIRWLTTKAITKNNPL